MCFESVEGQSEEQVGRIYFQLKEKPFTEYSRREIELHWRASGCRHIVNIKDVYENTYNGQKCLLVVMEW